MTPEEFEQSVKQLCGARLTGVRYYEIPGGFPDWDAKSEFDSVDHGLDLLCDVGEFHVTWDNTFWCYGLKVAPGLLIHHVTAAVYSDAATESHWTPFR